jgi:hypothetical protein
MLEVPRTRNLGKEKRMRRRLLLLLTALSVALIASAPAATAGPVVPYPSSPMGQSYSAWFRDVGQWFLGDSSNPLIAGLVDGECGQIIDGVFFMAAPIDLGVEFECEVPKGTAIVLSHAGWFVTQGIDGDTDEELQAALEAGFQTSANELSIDGMDVALQTIDTGFFDVISEPGSFYDTVLGIGTGPIRTAVRGNVVFLHPLSPGHHVIEAHVAFIGDGEFSATYHIDVG